MSSLALREPEQTSLDLAPVIRRAPRETPLKVLDAQQGSRFTAWLGRSGRRYVASRFALGDDAALGFCDSVLIAVGPERKIIAARDSGPWGLVAAVSRWREDIMAAGAVEIHVHLLAATADDRRRVVDMDFDSARRHDVLAPA